MIKDKRFRVWDGNKFVYFSALTIIFDYAEGESEAFGDGIKDLYKVIRNNPSVEFLQYTGLDDKNGKSVFEGDVLADTYGNKAVVVWDDYDTSFRLSNISEYLKGVIETPYEMHTSLFIDKEVIGNIYETPELLEEEGLL